MKRPRSKNLLEKTKIVKEKMENEALGHTVHCAHCLGHGFKSGLPTGPFLSEMFILF